MFLKVFEMCIPGGEIDLIYCLTDMLNRLSSLFDIYRNIYFDLKVR